MQQSLISDCLHYKNQVAKSDQIFMKAKLSVMVIKLIVFWSRFCRIFAGMDKRCQTDEERPSIAQATRAPAGAD